MHSDDQWRGGDRYLNGLDLGTLREGWVDRGATWQIHRHKYGFRPDSRGQWEPDQGILIGIGLVSRAHGREMDDCTPFAASWLLELK